ncbi:transposase [Streptomyces avermitilis]|uniref:transposase n=1 Tax=Streptomyces avermitilis TaxID=33903 RepID=UPI00371C2503
MPSREFVDKVLTACGRAATDEVCEATRALYMEALSVTHSARHAECRRADEAAAAQGRCEDVARALADLEARHAQEKEQRAQEIARAEGERDRVAQRRAAALAEAQLRIRDLTGQLAEERQGRRCEQATILHAFAEMMSARTGHQLPDWIEKIQAEGPPELLSFVNGVVGDQAAVTAGLTLPFSSGAVEGQVNRIKMLKRQMFGRASLDLLRKRVLRAA